MRIADVQLSFPAILIALLVNGVAKSVFGNRLDAMSTLAVLVVAIGLSFWVQYARTVRGSVNLNAALPSALPMRVFTITTLPACGLPGSRIGWPVAAKGVSLSWGWPAGKARVAGSAFFREPRYLS